MKVDQKAQDILMGMCEVKDDLMMVFCVLYVNSRY